MLQNASEQIRENNCIRQILVKASHFIQTYYIIMRPFEKSKTFISFDNAQCHCFQSQKPAQEFFLTKNQIPFYSQPQKSKIEISESLKQTLTKTSMKRSLKRMNSPPRNEAFYNGQNVGIDECSSIQDSMLKQKREAIILNDNISPVRTNEIRKPISKTAFFNFSQPQYGYNPHIKVNSPTFQQKPFQQTINPEKNLFPTNRNSSASFKKIGISKISFNFMSSPSKPDQSLCLKEQFSNSKIQRNLQLPLNFSLEKNLPETQKVLIKKMSEQIKIPKLQRKESKSSCGDLRITQTLTKKSMLYSGVNKSPEKTNQICDKIQIRQTATGLKDKSESDRKKQNKICQTTILKQSTSKSFIKTKRSLLSNTNRSKNVVKKQKTKPVLSKMQDVQEIRSLGDSDQMNDSDKQSVVLGRLKQYGQFNSTTILRQNTLQADLQRTLHFVQNQNSVIMDSPGGEWSHEVQSEYNY